MFANPSKFPDVELSGFLICEVFLTKTAPNTIVYPLFARLKLLQARSAAERHMFEVEAKTCRNNSISCIQN